MSQATAAVSSPSPEQWAAHALSRYPAAFRGTVKLLCLSENATFAVSVASGKRYVLRLHRQGYHSATAIRSELAWLDALRESGLQVPQALEGRNGEPLQTLLHEGQAPRHAVLFDWIDGHEPDPEQDLLASFSRLGGINALLHRHARSWQTPAEFERLNWNHMNMVGGHGLWGDWREAPFLPMDAVPVIETALARVNSELVSYGMGAERFGLIHADLRLANLLVQGSQTRIIDFDDCGFGWYMHDLASALSFHEHHADVPMWIEHWLKGYTREASLDETDIAMIPTLIIQRRVQLLAWTGSHANTATVRSLGTNWVQRTVELCRAWLDGKDAFL